MLFKGALTGIKLRNTALDIQFPYRSLSADSDQALGTDTSKGTQG